MNIQPEHLDALCHLGYTDTEASLLYLVSTHSGYFTQRQFLAFAQVRKVGLASRLIVKALECKHLRVAQRACHSHVYNLYSPRLCGAIDRENLRNRWRHSKELTQTRLLILDFVLADSDDRYLETEAEKVAYFHETPGLALPCLLGRVYEGLRSNSLTQRYFVDRFPVLLPSADNKLSLPPVVTFTYCDGALPSLTRYGTHLRSYETFLRRLPAFNFMYAAPNPSKLRRRSAFFAALFGDDGPVYARDLVRYFQLRLLWETMRASKLTRADRDFLRSGDKRYDREPFESAYTLTGPADSDINARLWPNRQTATARANASGDEPHSASAGRLSSRETISSNDWHFPPFPSSLVTVMWLGTRILFSFRPVMLQT
jgi:hypothetical protein